MNTFLTIGMATYDDFHGVYFAVQALRMCHDLAGCELVVVDNNPASPHGTAVKQFLGWVKGLPVKYVPMPEAAGTSAPRDRVFQVAAGEVVLCLDCHVLLMPGALAALRDYFAANADSRDIVSGPMVYDNLEEQSTHFADEWRGGMWGTWATDERGRGTEPFEIPAMGLGLFSMRKAAWPGFHPQFKGFGGEEFYIHEKVRRAGGKAVCLPALKWVHRFGRPEGVKYPASTFDKVRNYVLGHRELELPLERIHQHFVVDGHADGAGAVTRFPAEHWDAILAGATIAPGATTPGCNTCNGQPQRSQPLPAATLEQIFEFVAKTPRDLDQHAAKIRELASQAGHVTAFVKRREWNALLAAGRPQELVVYQAENDPLLEQVHNAWRADASNSDRVYTTHVGAAVNSLFADIAETDLLVLDTVHSAAQLAAELARHAAKVRGRILIRGTGAFGEVAEGGNGPGLLPAVRQFCTQQPEWTVIYRNDEQYGILVLSRADADKTQPPGALRKALNFAKALAAHAKDGARLVDDATWAKRMELCVLCPHRHFDVCGRCGCPVASKTSWAEQSCPDDPPRWAKEESP